MKGVFLNKRGKIAMKKKIVLIICIIVVSIIIIGTVLAFFTDGAKTQSQVNIGSVEIDPINLCIQQDEIGTMGKNILNLEPGDVKQIKWKVKNIGKSAIYTRHTLKIYWNEEIEYANNAEINLYPANLTKEQIIKDIQGEKKYIINKEDNKTIANKQNEPKLGLEYKFYGDRLDGTDAVGFSSEKNYNISDYEQTTDDINEKEDIVAFNLVINPKISYLFQNKTISIEVVTEAMQYNINGDAIWEVVDSEVI